MAKQKETDGKLDSQGRVMIDDQGNLIPPEHRKKPPVVIRYAEDNLGEFILVRNEETTVPKSGMMQLAPGQNQDGYGKKITSDIMLQVVATKKRYRVYTICFSNAGSNYVIVKGQRFYLQTYFQSDLKDAFLD